MPLEESAIDRKRKAAMAIALLNKQRIFFRSLELMIICSKTFFKSEAEPCDVVNDESFRFFHWKCFQLLKNGQIEQMIGVPQSTFSDALKFSRRIEGKICDEIRLCVFLMFLREGSTQSALHRQTGISQATISRIIKAAVEDFEDVAQNYIKFPSSKIEIRSLEKRFMQRTDKNGNLRKIPCFCLLDGKHWRCNHPPKSGSLNRNYKCYFSFNSLAVCDAETRVLYLQVSELGVNSDAQLFRSGLLPDLLEKARNIAGFRQLPDSEIVMPSFALADNGFALSKLLMLPYRDSHLTLENMDFNEKLSATRVLVEHLFGQISTKFKIFRRPLNLEPTTSRRLIVAAAVLHNMTKGPMEMVSAAEVEEEENINISDPYKTAEEQRTALKRYLQ